MKAATTVFFKIMSAIRDHLYQLYYRGTYIFERTPILTIDKELKPKLKQQLVKACFINNDESIENNFFYGFRQLTEVSVKALSPGINDPATIVQALRALTRLFIFRLHNQPRNIIKDHDDTIRVYTWESLLQKCLRGNLS